MNEVESRLSTPKKNPAGWIIGPGPQIRVGWKLDRLAIVGEIKSETNAGKAFDTAFDKVAFLRLVDVVATESEILDRMKRTPPERVSAAMDRLAKASASVELDPQVCIQVERLYRMNRISYAEYEAFRRTGKPPRVPQAGG